MNREIKVALGLLVCLVGLIVFMEFFSSSDQPVDEVGTPDDTGLVSIPEDDSSIAVDPIKPEDPIANTKPIDEDVPPLAAPDSNVAEVDNSSEPASKTGDDSAEPAGEIIAKVDPKNTIEHQGDIEEPKKTNISAGSLENSGQFPEFYIVQKGDTLSEISHRIYGSVKYMKLIKAENAELEYNRIFPGVQLKMPSREQLETVKKKGVTLSDSQYRVEKGDTIYSISRKLFGDDKKVKEIQQLNRNVDPQNLMVGQVLNLPKQ